MQSYSIQEQFSENSSQNVYIFIDIHVKESDIKWSLWHAEIDTIV